MAPVVLGVDVGSSSARVVALDPDGEVVGHAAARYPGSERWPPGWADPEGWLAGVGDALDTLRRELPAARCPAALGIGGQSPTTVPSDEGLAVTCRHPAGVTGTPEDQHAAQWKVLLAERADVIPLQLWDWLLRRLGAPPAQGRWPGDPELPGYGAVVPTGDVVGQSDGTLGLPAGTPLVPGAQDAYLSFWAGGLDTPGRGLDPGGRTGGLGVAVAAGARPEGMYGLPSAAKGVDIVGGPTSSHGLALEWWSRVTGRSVDELLALAAAAPVGSGGVVALPYLEGERAPRWNRALRGELAGLSPDAGPGEITRALLEGAAFGLKHIAATLGDQGVELDVLVCGGSPARSALWSWIKAAVLEVPVLLPEHPELAARGAGLAAGAAVGWWPQPATAGPGAWPFPKCRVVDPEPQAVYRDGYNTFLALGDAAVDRLRDGS